MDSKNNYDQHCPTCKENTEHVPKHQGFMGGLIKAVKITVFFVSFGMVYPHIFTEDEDVEVKCTKCGAEAVLTGK